jgi:DNA repair photolyase
MQYKEIIVNSIVNRITKKDSLFGGKYTIDPYQNCEFGCKYCDSSFDKIIYIKTNAEKRLKEEIKQIDNDLIIIGSVHDPYQKAEAHYKITRKLLEIIKNNNFSCHILTKSDLVLQDIDIISRINNCKVTISISSLKESITNIFEQDVIPPLKRLEIIKKLSKFKINAGIAQIPILPYISDNEFEKIISLSKKDNAKYFLYKYLELKGDQKQFYFDILKNHFPELIEKYKHLYQNSFIPNSNYISKLKTEINKLCKTHKIRNKI